MNPLNINSFYRQYYTNNSEPIRKFEGLVMPREKSCGAIVFLKNQDLQYLLLRYGVKYWGFVKGQVEANESEKDTVMRELAEETGITEARFVKDFREVISYYYRRRRNTIYKEVAYFLVEALNQKVKLSYEHTGYLWLSYEKSMEKLTFKNAKNVLKKAHNFLNES